MGSDDEASARERFQFALMAERLRQFKEGAISLHSLINDLEAALCELQETPKSWTDRFSEEWSVLEIAYAVADDHCAPMPTMNDCDIGSAVQTLSQMVADQLGP